MTGKVYLLGAGPGDPLLLTLRAQQCLKIADVVLHDRLIDDRILSLTSSTCEIIDVGKARGVINSTQATINSRLVELAKSGKQVIRLKGGDPLIFGRGSEEALELHSAGIPFEIVPGISSITGVPAYAGIPLTHRGISSGFTVINGSPGVSNTQLNWANLTKLDHTLVIVMGWQDLEQTIESLLTHGLPSATPIALVQWGTFPHQKTVTGTLGTISRQAHEADLGPPIITIVGEVVSLRDQLQWHDNLPLSNKRILITRDKLESRTLSQMLLERGATPIELPTIEFAPPESYRDFDQILRQIQMYDWIVFTSVHGVKGFFDRMWSQGKDARNLHGIQICCIGTATASKMIEYGLIPDFVPEKYSSQDILDAFSHFDISGKHVLLPRSDLAAPNLPKGLETLGATVTELVTYRNLIPEESSTHIANAFEEAVDIVIFASSSSVINLMKLLDGDTRVLSTARVACIGPVTAKTAQEHGLNVDLVPEERTLQGIIASIENFVNYE